MDFIASIFATTDSCKPHLWRKNYLLTPQRGDTSVTAGLRPAAVICKNGKNERMRELAKPMLKNQYGQYLLKVIDELKETGNPNLD